MEMQYILQLAQIIGYAIVATVFVMKITARVEVVKIQMSSLDNQLSMLNTSFARMGDILTRVAVQDTKIASFENDLRELRHGRGFININGEWDSKGKVK